MKHFLTEKTLWKISGLFATTSFFIWLCQRTHQRFKLRVVNEVELWDEEVVVFVTGVDVGLRTHTADAVKVVDVNVHKDPKKTAQDLLAHLLEVLGERYTWGEEENTISKR